MTRTIVTKEVTSQTLPRRPKKVNRKDPVKRREQNRKSSKLYREKQKHRVEELERLAAGASSLQNQLDQAAPPGQAESTDGRLETEPIFDLDTVDPSYLQLTSGHQSNAAGFDSLDLLPFDAGVSQSVYQYSPTPSAQDGSPFPLAPGYNKCGCPVLQIPLDFCRMSLSLMADPYINRLMITPQCVLRAFNENCLHLGISKDEFCTDEYPSRFFRPELEALPASNDLVVSTQHGYNSLKFDLRPVEGQLITDHHSYVDVIPFKDIRRNLIRMMDVIDEDDFFHDCLETWMCWGPSAGVPSGTPWDPRSWEASEAFIRKWSDVIGGEDGELARQSRWWQSMRGDRVTEII